MKKNFKTSILLWILSLFPLAGFSQEKVITVKITNVPLYLAIEQVEEASGVFFLYNSRLINPAQHVSVDKTNAPLSEVLDAMFKGTEIKYRLVDGQIVLYTPATQAAPNYLVADNQAKPTSAPTEKLAATNSLATEGVHQNAYTVNGIIRDEAGQLLPYATVTVKGTRQTVSSNENGAFVLSNISPQAVLVVSFIGYKTQEYALNGRVTVQINMESEISILENVVVTGYQTISRERSAGSFNIVSGSEVKDNATRTGSILDGLEGLTTGLSVNYSSGGGEKFLIRGFTSIEVGRSPLFVVDGVPMSSTLIDDMINSNDVESVTVLKDATSVSIWGARAANGVVVIATKKGNQLDRKIKISYDGNYTFRGKPDYSYNDLMNSEMFIKNMKEIFDPTAFSWVGVTTTINGLSQRYNPIVYPHELPMYQYLNGEISLQQRDDLMNRMAANNNRKQYEDYFMSNASFTNHTVTFSGGGDMHTFYGSLGYEGRQGTRQNTNDKYTVNLRQDFNFAQWFKLDVTLNASLNSSQSHGSIVPALTSLPYVMFADETGNMLSLSDIELYSEVRRNAENISGINLDFYPVNDFRISKQSIDDVNVRINSGLMIKLFKGLTYEGRFQYCRATSKTETYYPEETFQVRLNRVQATNTSGTQYLPNSGGYFTKRDTFIKEWIARNQFTYDRQFNDFLHQLTVLAGSEVRGSTTSGYQSFVRGYDYQTMKYITYDIQSLISPGLSSPLLRNGTSSVNVIATTPFDQSETEYRFVSFYANLGYTYNHKYTLNASVRVDQSNLFGSDPSIQFKPIWSFGTAWRVSEEAFMKDLSLLNRLTLRLSYGLAGNSPDPGMGGPYNLIEAYPNATFSTVGMGYIINTPANDKLTWEKTRTANFGLDFAFFKNRLSGSFDYYDKKTTDLLGDVLLNINTGWYSALGNLGTMTNKGFELSLTGRNVVTRDFEWNTTLALTHNKNMIVELTEMSPATTANRAFASNIYNEGYPAYAIFAYRWAGLDNLGHPQAYNELNEKVKITANIKELEAVPYMGTTAPPWFGALSNSFRYKNFDLSFMFIYNLGHKMRNDVNDFFSGRAYTNLHKDFDLRWRAPGDEANTNVPSYEAIALGGRTNNLYSMADINILDASYAKLRDLSLSYTLPKAISDKISADRVRVRLQASNLLLIAANKEGIDPEAFSLRNATRLDLYGPTFSVGLTVNFK